MKACRSNRGESHKSSWSKVLCALPFGHISQQLTEAVKGYPVGFYGRGKLAAYGIMVWLTTAIIRTIIYFATG
jgi:hypothetical protein